MALWIMDDEILRIEPYKNMQKIKALINIVPKIVGTLFILGASVDLFFRLKQPKSILSNPVSLVFFGFGCLAWLASKNQKNLSAAFFVWIDRKKERILFGKEHPTPAILESYPDYPYVGVIGFGDATEIILFRTFEPAGPDERTKGTTYNIALTLRDGSFFWIEGDRDKTTFIKHVNTLSDFLGLPIQDNAECGLSRKGTKSYKQTTQSPPLPLSAFVQRQETAQGLSITLRKKNTRLNAPIAFLSFSLGLGIPALLLRDTFSTQGFLGWFTTFFVGLLALAIWSFLGIFFLAAVRKVRVFLQQETICIEARYPLFLQKFLGEKLEIPRSAIQAVRVNRSLGGRYTLSLALTPSYEPPKTLTLMANWMSDIPSQKEERSITLWEIAVLQPPKDGPNINDLYHLEHLFQETLQLSKDA